MPVKGGPGAKSRLRFLTPRYRATLAAAMAMDTVAATLTTPGVGEVVVVSADDATRAWAAAMGAAVTGDAGAGLDAAVLAATEGRRGRVAVLLADHPALRPADLAAALAGCSRHERAVVADDDGTGTALLAACDVPLRPAFGAGSLRRHVRGGHHAVPAGRSVRLDVDDSAALGAALRWGVGPHTRAAVAATLGGVQATIHTSGPSGGSVLLDDGREMPYAAAALARSGLRHLRAGQRVSIDLDLERGEVTRVWVVGIGTGETIR